MNYRVVAISTKVADLVRSTMRSPGYGHPAHVDLLPDTAPAVIACARSKSAKRTAFSLPTILFTASNRCPCPAPSSFTRNLVCDSASPTGSPKLSARTR